MHLTLRQLQVFESVARHLSFTCAARELHLTQPAVSMQVKQLQNMVGMPLFEKRGRRATLTDAGRVMLRHSRMVMSQLSEIERDMHTLKGGSLKLCIASGMRQFAKILLAKFRAMYKSMHISLDVAPREEIPARLQCADAPDLALMERPPPGMPLEARVFMLNPLIVIATPRHPLAARRQIPLTEIAAQPMVMREPGTRGAMTQLFDQCGVRLAQLTDAASSESIKRHVETGRGLALVSAQAVELELTTGRVVALDLRNFPIMRKCYVARDKSRPLSPPASVFMQFALAESKRSGRAFALRREGAR